MKYIDEYRNRKIIKILSEYIKKVAEPFNKTNKTINFMEVCGTHTMSIHRNGLKKMLPSEINLISGPGCPVCVTPTEEIDKAIYLASLDNVIFTTFGDMMKVPGSEESLQLIKADKKDIRVVYSTLDALEVARGNPSKEIVFMAVGFETTSPTIASAVKIAWEQDIKNFSILCSHKLIPPAMKLLLDSGEVNVDGFLCPGHVSTIIGTVPYNFIAEEYNIACVVSGFEPVDIMQSIYMLVNQVLSDKKSVEIQYKRIVTEKGNTTAQELINEIFEVCDSKWRGLGLMPSSGLKLREKFDRFNAEKKFNIPHIETRESEGCMCGEILKGIIKPSDCPLFAKRCTPVDPVGPCMVSSEGTCAAYYKYSRQS